MQPMPNASVFTELEIQWCFIEGP